MLIRPQLHHLSQDNIVQQTISDGTNAAMQNWKDSDIGRTQRNIIMAAEDAITADQCAKNLQPLFDDLSWVSGMMGTLCDIQKSSPFANIELRSSRNKQSSNLLLHQNSKMSLHLKLIKSANKNKEICQAFNHHIFGPDIMIMSILAGKDAIVKQASLNDDQIFHHDDKSSEQLTQIAPYQIYDNNVHSINISPNGHDVIILQAIVKRAQFENNGLHRYRTYHDDNLVRTFVADETASRAQLMFSILREAGRKDAASIFEEWLRFSIFEMRWYVMREYLALDIHSALPHLIHMAQYDDEYNVRKTALGTLHLLRNNYPHLFETKEEEAQCQS